MKRPNGQSADAGSLKPLKNCVFESADAENLRCKSWMADARRSWHVAKCWRFPACLKSGIALSHHDVSKKDLDLGLSVH